MSIPLCDVGMRLVVKMYDAQMTYHYCGPTVRHVIDISIIGVVRVLK
jgi:hypothetical protein